MHEIIDIIANSELILVGCGAEMSFENQKFLQTDSIQEEIYQPLHHLSIYHKKDLSSIISDSGVSDWLHEILRLYYLKNINKEKNIYQKLYNLIKDKDYFIVNTNTDEIIYQSDLTRSRLVTPCGNEGLFQCTNLCSNEVWMNEEYVQSVIADLDIIMEEAKKGNSGEVQKYLPQCPHCYEKATLNIRKDASTYSEEGYISQWKVYMTWLQNSLNKKILMIELGENFSNPQVIRWPFEKNTFINNKARLIRVNEKFPHTPEEISEKSISIQMNSIDFLNKISENLE